MIPPPDIEGSTAASAATSEVPALVAHIFRRWYTRLVATLLRAVGTHQLDVVEDAVQDALLAALQHWPYRGIPNQPDAWLYQVARRKLLDRMARAKTATQHEPSVVADSQLHIPVQWSTAEPALDVLGDDELTMLFLCAHSALNADAQVTLMLRTVCGLTVPEIAAALLVPETTIAQRLVRAKRTLALQHEPFTMPPAHELVARLDVVLRALYLLFTEGYAATRGEAPVRHELCREAGRLATALAVTPAGATPQTYALCALLELQSSRLDARERADGTTVPLNEQDRRLWNRAAVVRGMSWLARACEGDTQSDYHAQAAIAAEHALTIDGGATNWSRIRFHYEQLLERTTSPVVRLNYAMAVARTEGAEAALPLLRELHDDPRLAANHLLPAMEAVLYAEIGQNAHAAASTRMALQRARTLADRALLATRLAQLAPENATELMSADSRANVNS